MFKYLIDGCFDGFHYGHVHALYQAKQLVLDQINKGKTGGMLVVGTHDNTEMELHKNIPLFNFNERSTMLKYCKYIDILIKEPLSYITSIETLDKYECQKFLHGRENVITKNNVDALGMIKNSERYLTYDITPGISTTNLVYRIHSYHNNQQFNTNLDYIFLRELFVKMSKDNVEISHLDNIILIDSSWDIFNKTHIEYLLNIKEKYPNYKIVCFVNNNEKQKYIYNQIERAIVLCGISLIDKVILDKNEMEKYQNKIEIIYEDDNQIIINNIIRKIDKLNVKLSKELDKISKYKSLKESYLDNNLYFKITSNQYDAIYNFLLNYKTNDNDIIIFDIDEVCLLNLMYTNNFYYSDLYEKYDLETFNFTNGLNPIIEESKKIFDLIHRKDINYAFITGRKDRIRELTKENLNKVNLNNYKYLYTCPNDFTEPISTFKNNCRKDISKNYNIICCIGDQLSDISGENTGIPFLIFNPFYQTI